MRALYGHASGQYLGWGVACTSLHGCLISLHLPASCLIHLPSYKARSDRPRPTILPIGPPFSQFAKKLAIVVPSWSMSAAVLRVGDFLN